MVGRMPAIVIDNGTGLVDWSNFISNWSIKFISNLHRYTKLGYAINKEPQFIIPSAISIRESSKVGDQASRRLARGIDDLDFYIGDECLDSNGYSVKVGFLLITLLCCLDDSDNFFSSFYTVSNQTWHCRRLGSDGTILGTMYLQIFESRAWRSLLSSCELSSLAVAWLKGFCN